MNNYLIHVKKEWREALRSYRLLILAVGLLSFALLNPLLLKLMPAILESQGLGSDLAGLMDMSQREALRSYLDSLYEIGSLVAVLSLMGVLSGEFNKGTWVIPLTSGANVKDIYWAKLSVSGGILFVFSLAGSLIAYVYGAALFGPDFSSFFPALKAGGLYGVYFLFVASLILMAGSFFKKPSAAAFVSLAFLFLLPPVAGWFDLTKWLPFVLLSEADALSPLPSKTLLQGILHTFAWMAVFAFATLRRLETMEKAR